MRTTQTHSPRVASVSEIVRAVEGGELFLEYQAVLDLRRGAMVSVEALVRWMHPRHGRLAPLSFMGVLDHAAFGVLVTRQVLAMATAQAVAWEKADLEVSVSVNVSPANLPAAVSLVAEALQASGLPSHRLTIEVTERRSPIGLRATRLALEALAEQGVRLSLDDFGVGEASLSRLQLVHFDEIKIDRSFVRRVDRDPTDRKICGFLIDLAHGLGTQVVAEGVERPVLLETVQQMGVDLAQGFAIHHPQSARRVGAVLHGPSGAWRRLTDPSTDSMGQMAV